MGTSCTAQKLQTKYLCINLQSDSKRYLVWGVCAFIFGISEYTASMVQFFGLCLEESLHADDETLYGYDISLKNCSGVLMIDL